MKKGRKGIIIAVAVILVLVVAVVLYFNLTKIEIADNYDLKITIEYRTTPTIIKTYYFYNNNIIATHSYHDTVPNGGSETITQYIFSTNIDLNHLKEFINKGKTENKTNVKIEENNKISYYIEETSTETTNMSNNSMLLQKIKEITDEAEKVKNN